MDLGDLVRDRDRQKIGTGSLRDKGKRRECFLPTSPPFLCEQKEILVSKGREEGWQKDRVTFSVQVSRVSALLLNT